MRDEQVVVPATLYRALEAKQARNAALSEEVLTLKVLIESLTSERLSLLERISEEGGTLKARDRVLLRQALSDVKDYEVYKDVMDQTFTRMKSDVEALSEERDRAQGRAERLDAARRAASAALAAAKRVVTRLEAEAGASRAERDKERDGREVERREREEVDRKHKHALKEIVRLKTALGEREEDIVVLKGRAGRLAAGPAGLHEHLGKGGAGGVNTTATSRAGASPKEWKNIHSSAADTIQASLSRAEGNLNAARKIMFN